MKAVGERERGSSQLATHPHAARVPIFPAPSALVARGGLLAALVPILLADAVAVDRDGAQLRHRDVAQDRGEDPAVLLAAPHAPPRAARARGGRPDGEGGFAGPGRYGEGEGPRSHRGVVVERAVGVQGALLLL